MRLEDMPRDPDTLPGRILIIHDETGVPLREMSRKANMSHEWIGSILRGRSKKQNYPALRELASAMGYSQKWLLDGVAPKRAEPSLSEPTAATAPAPHQPTVERGLRHEALEALVARERYRWSHGAVEEARSLRFALKDQPNEAAWAKILDDIERKAKAAAKGKVVHQVVTSDAEADAPELRDALEELDGKLEHAGLDLLDRQAWAAKLRERWTEDADAYELVKALVAEATKKPAKKKAKR